jgi:hypothetical protein
MISLDYLSSLFKSRDEIYVKWGRSITPQNFYFGLLLENIKKMYGFNMWIKFSNNSLDFHIFLSKKNGPFQIFWN